MYKYFLLLIVANTSFTIAFNQETKKSVLFDLVSTKIKNTNSITETVLFELNTKTSSPLVNDIVSEKQMLTLKKQASIDLYGNAPAAVMLAVPLSNQQMISLKLIKEDITNVIDFSFGTLRENGADEKELLLNAIHYRGYIMGDSTSIAAVSIFSDGEVMGLFSGIDGNFNLGQSGDDYILYNSKNMKASLGFECGTSEIPIVESGLSQPSVPMLRTQEAPLLCKKVRVYWEGDYKLFANNFSSNLTATTNYLTGLFNQVAVMYLNEGITIELSDLYVWTQPNGYNNSSSTNGLNSFKGRWNSLGNAFKGDLAVLIDGAPTNNGGLAYLLTNNLCNRSFAYGYADIYGYYNTLPTYSWDVEVVTHEMGHMMGANHTHWCGWNTGAGGTCGAIDDCATVQTTTACTSCVAATTTNPPPAGFKGTVMSYCHLRSGIGINLANGFGPLPQAVIRSTVSNAACTIYNNIWTGAFSNAWEDVGNWSCNAIPTATTDVTIPSGLAAYPVINSAAICRKIKYQMGATIQVNTGYKLSVVGTSNW